MQGGRAKSERANLGQILKLEEHLSIGAVAVTMNHRFAFFIVFGQRPGNDALHVARAKSGPTVRIEHVAGPRFVEYGPNFQTFAQLPAAAVQNSAAPQKPGRFALILRAFSQKVNCLLAGYFQTDRFKGSVHFELRAKS